MMGISPQVRAHHPHATHLVPMPPQRHVVGGWVDGWVDMFFFFNGPLANLGGLPVSSSQGVKSGGPASLFILSGFIIRYGSKQLCDSKRCVKRPGLVGPLPCGHLSPTRGVSLKMLTSLATSTTAAFLGGSGAFNLYSTTIDLCSSPTGYICSGSATAVSAGTCTSATCAAGYGGSPSAPMCSSTGIWSFIGACSGQKHG